jgi:UDP-N-acetyl-D-glucosamine dehydrogenase
MECIKGILLEKFESKSAVIGIFGLGYVGLPLAIRFVEAGFNVIGFDIDKDKIIHIESGKSYFKHIDDSKVASAISNGFSATTEFPQLSQADALIICVPTPLNKSREPDLSFVTSTMDLMLPHLRVGQIVSLESTTYPGTTEEELLPRIESTGLNVGKDVFLVYSPEREDPGNQNFETRTIPKICGGHTKNFNIGLVNEMKIVADKMGIDIHEVIDAAATKPFGFTPYYPGPGLGGHCIPIDPFYLTWKAREYGLNTRFIELAGEVNTAMPEWVISKLSDALNERSLPVKGSRILVLGIAYKKNVDDMRESPSVELMQLLANKGAIVDYSDPYVPVFPTMRKYQFDLQSVELSEAEVKSYDCIVLATNHDCFDYSMIRENAVLIVDTRGHYGQADNIVKA